MSKKAPNAHIGVDDLIDFEVIFSRDANVEDSLSKVGGKLNTLAASANSVFIFHK